MGLDIVILFGARNREAMRFFLILTQIKSKQENRCY